MTRIRFKVLRAIALLQLTIAGLLLGLANAELEFYQDEEPKLANKNFERLARLLEANRHTRMYHHMQPAEPATLPDAVELEQLEQLARQQQQHELAQQQQQQQQQQYQQQIAHHNHHSQLQQQAFEELQQQQLQQQQQQRMHQQHLLELARQKEKGLLRDDLPERPNIIDVLQRESADPFEYVLELERQRLLPYLEFEPEHRPKPYSLEDETRARLLPAHVNKDPMLDYPESQYIDLERARHQLENVRRLEENHRQHRPPPFEIDLDKLPPPSDPNGPPPFAVRPNDPRYFEEDPIDKPTHKENHHHEPPLPPSPSREIELAKEHNKEEALVKSEHETTTATPRQRHNNNNNKPAKLSSNGEDQGAIKMKLIQMNMLPEPQRRAEQGPLMVSLNRKANNDVYFIAIVAGCSAATMFALVLISLTWCRLQRVSKAAADVEYPAYGVTGPNKDISPSGDQRLAQSAQMYHFQHQKQQIIAMENRTSAARDPGSVSEAESDEEHEEGDYTVYECPGLAPTAEMEVKNPLFDDDPTPATPAKSRKSADDDV